MSPAGAGLEGAERLAAEVPRQIANANTLFNVLNTAAFIGFTGWFARFATWLVPDRKEGKAAATPPPVFDEAASHVPAIALEQVRQELGRLGELVQDMLAEFPPPTGTLDPAAAARLSTRRDEVEALHGAVLEFLVQMRQGASSQEQSETQVALMTIAVHFREMAELIADDLANVARSAASRPVQPSATDGSSLSDLCHAVRQAVGLATAAVRRRDVAAATAVTAMSAQVRQLGDDLMSRLAAGLEVGGPDNLADLRFQTTCVNALRQTFTLTKRIARAACPP